MNGRESLFIREDREGSRFDRAAYRASRERKQETNLVECPVAEEVVVGVLTGMLDDCGLSVMDPGAPSHKDRVVSFGLCTHRPEEPKDGLRIVIKFVPPFHTLTV
jgi:hypothetical protein